MSDFEGKVFFVDDEELIRNMLGRSASILDLDYEVLEDAPSAVARLEGLDEVALAVFTDGLYGGWRDVVNAAKAARVPVAVLTGDEDIQPAVEEAGAVFFNKNDFRVSQLQNAIEAVRQDSAI